jgi:hypothetical protein
MEGYAGIQRGTETPEKSSPLGHVVSVTGSQVRGLISCQDFESGFQHVQVGNLVRIAVGDTALFGIVRGMHIENPTDPPSNGDQRYLDLELLGQANLYTPHRLIFARGVTTYQRPTRSGSDRANILI